MAKSLTQKPPHETTIFFLCLLVWPVFTGEVGILASIFLEKAANRSVTRSFSALVLALAIELTIGLFPSICIAILITILSGLCKKKWLHLALSTFIGGIFAFPFSLVMASLFAKIGTPAHVLERPVFMSIVGGCVAAVCSMPLCSSTTD